MAGSVLIVFVKAPRPGAVKTRLVASLGAQDAALVYRALAEAEIAATAPAGAYRRIVFFSPADARAEVGEWLPGETLAAQEGRDLGERMGHALAAVLASGAESAAIVGTDVPWLTRALIEEAFAALDTHDLVIGPALDGGYYLLALRQAHRELFTGIAWGTPEVLPATRARAEGLGLSVRELSSLPDVDTIDDLRRSWARLRPLFASRPDLAHRIEGLLEPERRR